MIQTALELGVIPDALLRPAIRAVCRRRLYDEAQGGEQVVEQRIKDYLKEWHQGDIAIQTDAANTQHYEVPAEFYDLVLGPHRKYSCCLYEGGLQPLEKAEAAMLNATCQFAQVQDGQSILDLGCGWGSLSLWLLDQYPNVQVTAVSNSNSQRQHIETLAERAGVAERLTVVTCDINHFDPISEGISNGFDRVMSVEMFEHMRNHAELLKRISSWLKDDGRLFVHVFCHRDFCYPYEDNGPSDWMAREFFTGGIMPSFDMFRRIADDMTVVEDKWISGQHYQQTSEHWLELLDQNRQAVLALFGQAMNKGQARRQFNRWRIFFLAVAECFGLDRGRQWGVGHYLLKKNEAVAEANA